MSMDVIEVTNAKTWSEFARQETGTDWYYKSSLAQVGRHAKKFFEEYPSAGWKEFANVVLWAKDRKFRPAHVGALAACWPYAINDEYIMIGSEELHGFDIDAMVYSALEFETDPQWRRRLLVSHGQERVETYEEYKREKEKELDE